MQEGNGPRIVSAAWRSGFVSGETWPRLLGRMRRGPRTSASVVCSQREQYVRTWFGPSRRSALRAPRNQTAEDHPTISTLTLHHHLVASAVGGMQGFPPAPGAGYNSMVPHYHFVNSHPLPIPPPPPTVLSQPITGDHAAARAHRSAVGWALALAQVCHRDHNGLMVASSQWP